MRGSGWLREAGVALARKGLVHGWAVMCAADVVLACS